MSNHTSNFNGFPTDNSSSTNLKYDLIASKFMTGIENHNKHRSCKPPIIEGFGIIGSILEGLAILIMLIVLAIGWVLKKR